MSKFVRHLFVCTNERAEGSRPACAAHDLYRALMAETLTRGLSTAVAITATGCLGPCFDGPTVVVYPEGVWYSRVQPSDARELVEEHLANGRPVERLRHHWPDDA